MPNALQHETSPYLLQHADNPVDWLPWGPEAHRRARELDRPILLSIGYSACHWCHVMAHESFEDAATAELMNRLFVNIKVDREERPDLDRIYQMSQQLFSGRPGGWPLTVFLTPDEHWPIFAGTYFPKAPGYGMPSFQQVLQRVADFARDHRADIETTAGRLLEALAQTVASTPGELPDESLIQSARRRLGESFDAVNGGFGQAPKFPHPSEIGFLLTLAQRDKGARRLAETTLISLVSRGLFDHLGGGFFRYCVDAEWRIPHFEKMLYDNAALLGVLSQAAALTSNALLESAASATADWMMREMRDDGGAFYATLDADSEGEEGRFYTFVANDFRSVLNDAELEEATHYFGLDRPPNFEDRCWHLQPGSRALPFGTESEALVSARTKLLALREQRIRPGRDEKILTAWNGLAIANLARAARYLGRDDLGLAARQATDFIHDHLLIDDKLRASFKDGRARFMAYLDDYAFMAFALTELMQWRFRRQDLEFAMLLADSLLERFSAPAGGFFFTANDHETLIHRPQPFADEAIPAGNGMAALALDTLGHLLGEPRYLDAARATLGAAESAIRRHSEAHTTLLVALRRRFLPPELIIVRGDETGLGAWRQELDVGFWPERLLFFIPDSCDELPGALGMRPSGETTTAWVCRGPECLAPITNLSELRTTLDSESTV